MLEDESQRHSDEGGQRLRASPARLESGFSQPPLDVESRPPKKRDGQSSERRKKLLRRVLLAAHAT